jgi:hypothetical protein
MRATTPRREPVLALPPPRAALPASDDDPDLREVSPRRFAQFAHELYMGGALTWEQYQLCGFPSELDPRWDVTIGALTGEKAEPDRPRDMFAEWERRLQFMRRYQSKDPATMAAERVLDVLSRFAAPVPRQAEEHVLTV